MNRATTPSRRPCAAPSPYNPVPPPRPGPLDGPPSLGRPPARSTPWAFRRGLAPALLALALCPPAAAQGEPDPERRAARAALAEVGAAVAPCLDYSAEYRAPRLNADPRWTCGFADVAPIGLEEALLAALRRRYEGRFVRVFSPPGPNPDCSCRRAAAYFRRGGRLVAWSFSSADLRPYGRGAVVWVKHQVLP